MVNNNSFYTNYFLASGEPVKFTTLLFGFVLALLIFCLALKVCERTLNVNDYVLFSCSDMDREDPSFSNNNSGSSSNSSLSNR